MGCAITELLHSKEIQIDDLSGKICAVDALNILFQFLTTIRQRDGTPLMDSRGQITSHLNGLFNRTTALMEKGLRLVFVFDGVPPKLKEGEQMRRVEAKQEAQKRFEEAKEKGDVLEMRKYSSRMHKLDGSMIEESKELLSALGIPVIQAPSEGEAQAAFMVSKGDAYCVVSQDADALLFGGEKVVRNLSIAGRKKKTNRLAYEIVKPEMIDLSETLKGLGINHKQLIVLGILVGTDYNPGGVHGLGPKKGLKIVKEYGDKYGKDEEGFDSLFKNVKWEFGFSWREVYDTIVNIPVEKDYKLKWSKVDVNRVKEILCKKHDFSEANVEKKLNKIVKVEISKAKVGKEGTKQGSLDKWF